VAARRTRKLVEPGSRAPDFSLQRLDGGLDGSKVTLQELVSNGPLLLAFFKISCPVCQFTFPFLERIHAAGSLPIYGISQNDAEDTREFNLEFGVTFPTLLDLEESGFPASNDYGISSVPTMFLLDPGGAVAYVFEGWNKKEIAWLGEKAGMNPFRQGDNVPEWKAG
jgi:peroxiredoxin